MPDTGVVEQGGPEDVREVPGLLVKGGMQTLAIRGYVGGTNALFADTMRTAARRRATGPACAERSTSATG